MFALGNVDFGASTTAAAVWQPLPGTAAELAALRTLLPPGQLVIASGGRATWERVQRELQRAHGAHLATHGFFAAEELRSDQVSQEGPLRNPAKPVPARNPLAYCGLVLAGANGSETEAVPAKITGEDILGLDLDRLALVVLSACESGLGDVAAREGTFGLPRAFHLAGCRNVVASQWPVDDEATAAIMAGFYRQLVVQRQPPLTALRHAQLAVLRHPARLAELSGRRGAAAQQAAWAATDEPHTAATDGGRRSPAHLWAAFCLSGPGN